MSTATVKYIANGFAITSFGSATVPESVYAASIPEVVYWIGRLFDPLAPAAAMASKAKAPTQTLIQASDDPLLNQEAQVATMASGGFIVRQMPGMSGATLIDTYCVNMDAVSAVLTEIFTPPEAPPA